MSVTSLVVNGRNLPAILRNRIQKLRLNPDVSPLVAAPSRLWGALHSDVWKQILHRGNLVTILSVHRDLRLVAPVGGEAHRAFWIPRRRATRQELTKERIKRSYERGIRTAFVSPHYTGEARPAAEVVQLPRWENLISEELYRLTKSLGQHENGLIPEASWPDIRMRPPTSKQRRELKHRTRQKYAVLKEKLRERVLRQVLAKARLPEAKQFAVYDVIALGNPLPKVASARNLTLASLENTVERIKTKTKKAYQQALAEAA